MKIITFGSCLSRYIANALLRQTNKGGVLNSVYHNRIDAFLANHVDNLAWLPPLETLVHGQSLAYREFIRPKGGQTQAEGETPLLRPEKVSWASDERPPLVPGIVLNQYPQGLGLHLLQAKHCSPLLHTLQNKQADVIVVDNYVDIGARLLQVKDSPQHQFFYNNGWLTQGTQTLNIGGLLPVDEAVDCWIRWLSLLKQYQPSAQLVVAPFPCNAFVSPQRCERAKTFILKWRYHLAKHPELEAWMLPTHRVHKAYLNANDPLHFNDAFYGVMAGSLLARQGSFNWLDAHDHDISLETLSPNEAAKQPKQLVKRFWHKLWS
jgi:hypothetical protein